MTGSGDVAFIGQLSGDHTVDRRGDRGITHLALRGAEASLGLSRARHCDIVVQLHLLELLTADHFLLEQRFEALVISLRILHRIFGLTQTEPGLFHRAFDIERIDREQTLALFHRLTFRHRDVLDVAHETGSDLDRFERHDASGRRTGDLGLDRVDQADLGLNAALGGSGGFLGFGVAAPGDTE
jgi:hypothetical protein